MIGLPLLHTEGPYRHHHHAVFATIAEVSQTNEYHEKRRRAHALLINLVCKRLERLRSLRDGGLAAELNFDKAVGAIAKMDYGVGFKTGLVAVMCHRAVHSGYVNPQVADTHAFEQETKRVQISDKVGWRRSECRSCNRGIDEVSRRRSAYRRLGAQVRTPSLEVFYNEQSPQSLDVAKEGTLS